MATTSLWRIRGNLKQVCDYAKNHEKTKDVPLNMVIDYAMKDDKVRNESGDKIYLVSGINCTPETCVSEMNAIKKHFNKTGEVVAYHGYQSFAEGEVTPQIAHEIGVKLAEKLWGENYQVVVTTHVNKTSHYHNHFVINTVSFVDGKKFHRTKGDYFHMKTASDELCREYGLSVIEAPQGKGKHYAEWKADNEGKPTWRGIIKEDVDRAISSAFTMNEFFANMEKMGYEIKSNVKYMAIRPEGKERFVRLKSLGNNYTEEAIKEQILYGKKVRVKSRYEKSFNPFGNKGLKGLYYYYLYQLGILPKKDASKEKKAHFLIREELTKLDTLTTQYEFLAKHNIETIDELNDYRDSLQSRIEILKAETAKEEDSDKTQVVKDLKKEVKLCNQIEEYSKKLYEKAEQVENDKKSQNKNEKEKKNELIK